MLQQGFVAHQWFLHVAVPIVKSAALAIFEIFTRFTLPTACPATVPEGLKSGVPDVIQTILIDIALDKRAVNIGAG